MGTQQFHDQIARATSRLAHLQARELLAKQRADARAREATRKRAAQRRAQLGALVIAAGAEDLADGEFVAALLNYRAGHATHERRQQAKAQGDAHLAALAADSDARRH